MRVEHEYDRGGAWAYLAALDVHRGNLFGRCERTTGIAPFDRLVSQVMSQSSYREARRIFWIVDNGSSHRGIVCERRALDYRTRRRHCSAFLDPVSIQRLQASRVWRVDETVSDLSIVA